MLDYNLNDLSSFSYLQIMLSNGIIYEAERYKDIFFEIKLDKLYEDILLINSEFLTDNRYIDFSALEIAISIITFSTKIFKLNSWKNSIASFYSSKNEDFTNASLIVLESLFTDKKYFNIENFLLEEINKQNNYNNLNNRINSISKNFNKYNVEYRELENKEYFQKILVDNYYKNQQQNCKNNFFEINYSNVFKNQSIKPNLNENIIFKQNAIPTKNSISNNFDTNNLSNRNIFKYNGNLESHVRNFFECYKSDDLTFRNHLNYTNSNFPNNLSQFYYNHYFYKQKSKSSKKEISNYFNPYFCDLNSTKNYNHIEDYNALNLENFYSEEKITNKNYIKEHNNNYFSKNNFIYSSDLFNREPQIENNEENSNRIINHNCYIKNINENLNLRNQSNTINNKNMFDLMNNYHNFNNLSLQFTSKQIDENNINGKEFYFKNDRSDLNIKKNDNRSFENNENFFDNNHYLNYEEKKIEFNIEKNEQTLIDRKTSNLNIFSKNFKEEIISSQDDDIEIISIKSDNCSELSVNTSFEITNKKFYEYQSDSTKIEESSINETPDNSICLKENADNKILYIFNSVNRLEAELLTKTRKNNKLTSCD